MSGYALVFGTSVYVTIGITLMLGGGCALMTGRALALTWRPDWQMVPYCALLAVADRFLVFALFGGELLSLSGYAVDFALLLLAAAASFQAARARQMVRQYPWLYRPAGPFGWREIR
jgi:hypothetical protein